MKWMLRGVSAATIMLLVSGGDHAASSAAEPSGSAAKAAWWPQFRGPSGDGIAMQQNPPVEFGGETTSLWRTELVGKGWSSPVVADGVVWMTTAVERQPTEEERLELLRKTDNDEKKFRTLAIAASIELKLLAVDLQSGSLTKTIDLTTVQQPDAIHSLNSYASPTPVIDGGSVFCHFGTFGTFCIDRDSGDVVWSRVLPLKHAVGPGSSPMVYDDKLILIQDGMEQQYVVALDKATGETIWKADRPPMRASNGDQRKSYCTPIAIEDSKGRDQLICMGAQWMISLDPSSGEEIWRVDHGSGFSVVPRPVVHQDLVMFATGFGSKELWAVDVTGTGDVSNTHVRWTVSRGVPTKPSPLLLDGLLYIVDDSGVASCFAADDGSVVWKKRLGGNFSASPLLAGGRIYFANHDGDVFVVRPGDEFDLVQENHLGEQIMASPVAVEDSLLIRTDQAIYRF
ncbi:outer membrane protein assembly factor BamB family protein [Crateriforma conspicua]|uniref:Serine/threonine-protein kinase AfsK n=1 Tax=Crateriforma conspicua TaxID=2527996 RepID=A0A5C5Y980_9PLAN|nr:PQQ-binding-like beta-propeller repeat protein [Crateriforma conspicua]TWT69922.1 Serine/threonine-protein kinase AfsK [Crateriforma conspicua]